MLANIWVNVFGYSQDPGPVGLGFMNIYVIGTGTVEENPDNFNRRRVCDWCSVGEGLQAAVFPQRAVGDYNTGYVIFF